MKLFRLFVCCVAMQAGVSAADVRNTPEVLSSDGGRFVFGQVSEFGRDKFMLDTQTGRLWRVVRYVVKNSDGSENEDESHEALTIVPYREEDGKLVTSPLRPQR